jgi:hypothetical protein
MTVNVCSKFVVLTEEKQFQFYVILPDQFLKKRPLASAGGRF